VDQKGKYDYLKTHEISDIEIDLDEGKTKKKEMITHSPAGLCTE